MGSPPFSLNWDDWKKIGKGAAIAAAGALIVYLQQVGLTFDQTTFNGAAMFFVSASAVNLLRKLLANHEPNEPNET